ncbi:hypothetical protein K450DRAFT_219420 [Umbelopsis ramanniana AG]|uniref:Glucuronosyltransferase n=1 Tax=Umbelopsis ramanniana AG TaxID=1314678 RepID=A0AAD5EL36_UMBRA|nr:uncharacterized protein K450DRAFT_219420 [Umbelopsis ramanniana AG]KAI8584350.1 hypothetical protein K450DRAFT_219420 [Umbelopsis ramanniana AG]
MVSSSRTITAFLLCCFLAVVVALEDKRKLVALAAIPFPGHAKPLHRIGQELALRGYDVKMFMMKRAGYTKAFEKDPLVEFIPLGDYEKDVCDEETYAIFAQDLAFNEGPGNLTLGMMCMFGKSSTALKDGLTDYITNVQRPDILISDYASFAATDIGNHLGIPTVVNLPGFQLRYDFFSVPIGTGMSRKQTASLPYRFKLHLFEAVQRLAIGAPLGLTTFAHWNRLEMYEKAVVKQMGDPWNKNPFIVNNMVGLDYAQFTGSHHYLSGPILSKPEAVSNVNIDRENCEDIRPWLNATERPIIYISFGTTGSFTKESMTALLEGFKNLHEDPRYSNYDMLWRIPYSQRPLIVPNNSNSNGSAQDLSLSFFPKYIHSVDWLCSQEEVLSHPNVKLFITHGGANSPWESIRELVPMVVVPSFFDQNDMAIRIHDRELGVRIRHPLTCTKEEVLEALHEILDPTKYERVLKNLRMVRALLRNLVGDDFSDGAKNAANYVESLLSLNGDFSHLLPIQTELAWWQVQQWDLIGIYVAIASLTTASIGYLIGARSKRSKVIADGKKDQ